MKMGKLAVSVLLLVIALSSVSFIADAQAVTYNEITGKLGGADYILRKPSNWGGDLLVFCRGYAHSLSEVSLTRDADLFKTNMISKGYMFVESSFGEEGYCIQKAIIRTHQLTEYVIENYQVQGKVFLVGVSMGGNIALQLGAKYPDLYDAVLDVSGGKDVAASYTAFETYAGISDDAALSAAVIANGGLSPPYPTLTIGDFRAFCQHLAADIEKECGGTPDSKPQAYKRISPINSSTDIVIPTITIHGTKDGVIPYSQSDAFKNAVAASGHSDLYRLYWVTGGQHLNLVVLQKVPVCINLLIDWVKNGNAAPTTTPW